uniref:NADH-ubiquinone oxidoreductase chain 2 n=1 Tax=Anisocentropus maculatus TaxID=2904904 RepID=A0A9E8LNN4_9NEOP|nr:NADH dehydrogenase subunit 2 [Anisocentropus maculatus]UZZ43753.1 NADH dehydrogenase subunit 2 [Anisocentropus maculatus]
MFINFNIHKILLYFIMIMSILYSISSNTWINMWIGMEINLMAFIPLMSKMSNLISSECMMKYFLIQAFTSMNFIFIIFLSNFLNKWFYMNFYNYMINILINLTLIMKMGAAPFFFWFPKVMKGLNWLNCFILMSWQKIIPMIMISMFMNFKIINFSVFFSIICGSILGLNQSNLKLIMSYSSIHHMGWMMIILKINMNLWNIYFFIYLYLNYMIIYFFNMMQLFHLTQLYLLNTNLFMKMTFFMNFLSLSGIPPFLGFFPKWITINFLMMFNMNMILFTMIMFSLINFFFYLRITYSSFFFYNFKFKFMKFYMNKFMNKMNFYSLMSSFNLISIILFFNIY